ncbi:MAG: hypothetical protein NC826_00475 [Candidatus Omnitrophica bacterium]|nr:hypothetical protein [Candidatus Omnitrophota bacterium]
MSIEEKKALFYPKSTLYVESLDSEEKEGSLMFYPYLPYSFIIYFKDRQKISLEFLFYTSKREGIAYLKRKISCGNLEVDLLVMRYITRSLCLLKDFFSVNEWQTVKIELSRKDDKD